MESKKWKHPGSPPPMKFKRVHSAGKVMVSIFWDSQGEIVIDYLEQGRMINGAYYTGELRLLHGNAPTQTSQVAMTVATECGFEILPHPSYSPDMALSVFYLFLKKVSEYDKEIPQSQTADNPLAPRGRAAQPSRE